MYKIIREGVLYISSDVQLKELIDHTPATDKPLQKPIDAVAIHADELKDKTGMELRAYITDVFIQKEKARNEAISFNISKLYKG